MPLIPNSYTPDTIIIGTIAAGRKLGYDDLAIVCAIACQKVESNHVMYANDGDPHTKDYPYQAISRDENSAGIYQQRFPWWDDPTTDDFGGSSDRMDVFRSTKMFLVSLVKQHPNYHDNPGEAIANTQQPRADLRWKYGAQMDYAWGQFNRLKDATWHVTVPPAPAEPFAEPKPQYTELERFGNGFNSRSRPINNWFVHTEQGNSNAEQLAAYCDGSHGVSYHYTLRNRILCDVVDTDYYSWSVLNANVFSINGCFAGSYAEWSTEEWMKRRDDIDIMAYIAVQDCRKYPQMSTLVIPPPYRFHGPGVSDHRYVTKALGIGTHVDVGDGYPWEFFGQRIGKYNGNSNSGDELTKEEHDALMQLWGSQFNLVSSDSPYAPPGEGNRWPTKDMVKHIDGFLHPIFVEHNAIILGQPADINTVYEATQYDDDKKADRAKRVWDLIPDDFKTEAAKVYPDLAKADV
jgi:hypothetical protein